MRRFRWIIDWMNDSIYVRKTDKLYKFIDV